jgi:uncharacterized protein YwgA
MGQFSGAATPLNVVGQRPKISDSSRFLKKWVSTAAAFLTTLVPILYREPVRTGSAQPGTENLMDRRELLLAVLAAGKGRQFSPAQIQKAIFLIDKNLPHLVHSGPRYNFVPYNYGPFDRSVYDEAENLKAEGRVVIATADNGRWSTYAAADRGIKDGAIILERLKQKSRRYVESVVDWVLAQSFGSLVKAIYDEYPEMKENSIFQG